MPAQRRRRHGRRPHSRAPSGARIGQPHLGAAGPEIRGLALALELEHQGLAPWRVGDVGLEYGPGRADLRRADQHGVDQQRDPRRHGTSRRW